MRARALSAVALLLLPTMLSAQRFPRGIFGGRHDGPTGAQPLPQQPLPIARAVAYQRMRVSTEVYPMVSYVDAPGYGTGAMSHWTTFGAGSRVDYRLQRYMSATLDITESFLGGPARTETGELGVRFRPERNERKFYPFLDLRAAYVGVLRNSSYVYMDPYGYGGLYYGEYSYGYGAVAGVGAEYALSRRFSLVSSASMLHSAMTSRNLQGPYTRSDFTLTSYRYVLALRFNPVRMLR